MDKVPIGGIISVRGLTMLEVLGLPNKPGYAGQILTLLGDAAINLHFIAEGEDANGMANITICIDPARNQDALQIINRHQKNHAATIIKSRPLVSLLTIYGPHFREKPAICGKMCYALGKNNINILGISTSISSVCCIVTDDNYQKAYDSLLTVFSLP